MKVLHVVGSFSAGTFEFVASLIRSMPEHEHTIIHGMMPETPPDYPRFFPENTAFVSWRHVCREISPIRDVLALGALIKALAGMESDVIHLHSSKAGFHGRVSARLLGRAHQVIYTSHAAAFLRRDAGAVKRKVFVLMERLAAGLGGVVVACSPSEREAFVREGIQANLIENGISLPEATVRLPRDPAREFLVVGTVGRICPQKGPVDFKAIAGCMASDPVRFVWVGEGPQRFELQAPNIEITGWLTPEEVRTRLTDFDIYLSTSKWEGLPISVLQAMARSKPLVLFRCPGNVDMVDPGVNGFLVDDVPEAVDRIRRLAGDERLLTRLGQESQAIARRRFDLADMVREYRTLYATAAFRQE